MPTICRRSASISNRDRWKRVLVNRCDSCAHQKGVRWKRVCLIYPLLIGAVFALLLACNALKYAIMLDVYPTPAQESLPNRVTTIWSKQFPEIKWVSIHFTSSDQKELFGRSHYEIQFLRQLSEKTPESELFGELQIIRYGTFQMPYDCGYKSSIDSLLEPRQIDIKFEKLMPLIIPDGWSFQHFTDGTLPKLIMALPWIHSENIPILLETPRDNIIYEMLAGLNISNIVWHPRGSRKRYGAEKLYFACHTPPLHPQLWQKARSMLAGNATKGNKIVILKRTRNNSHNAGRFIRNYESIVKNLRQKYESRIVEYDSSEHNLASTISIFASASWIIGAHGGAIFNQIFAPEGTNVVEYMPVKPDGSLYLRHAGMMSYVFSSLLNQVHWRITDISQDGNVDLMLDLPANNDYFQNNDRH